MNGPDSPVRRRPTFSLGRLMMVVAILALLTAIVVQSIRLGEAAAREEQLRARWESDRARLEAAAAQAAILRMKLREARIRASNGARPANR
jgi:hypothetical protein